MELQNTTIALVLDIITTLSVAAIAIACTCVLVEIGNNKRLMNIQLATDNVVENTLMTVGELKQTVVDALKEEQGDTLTDAQMEKLKSNVILLTQKKLSDPVVNLLEGAHVDVRAMITGAAEDWISSMK
jgi:hypothetical protein